MNYFEFIGAGSASLFGADVPSIKRLRSALARTPTQIEGKPLIDVPDIGFTQSVVNRIKLELNQRNYQEDRVILRAFATDRLDQMLSRGTDRDEKSTVWNWSSFDSNAEARQVRHVDAERIIYGIDVDMTHIEAPNETESHPPGIHRAWELPLQPSYMTIGCLPHTAIAVYARSGLERAQIGSRPRTASVEFWFKGQPKDQLLFVVRQDPNVRDRRR